MVFDQTLELVKNAILPLAAVAVSILVWWHSKRVVYANIIASGRLDWIRQLRDKLGEFAGLLLLDESPERTRALLQKKFEIECYLDYAHEYPDYEALRDTLAACIAMPADAAALEGLLDISQKVLGNCYRRAKLEAGITGRNERHARRHNYREHFGDSNAVPPDGDG